MAVDIDGVNSTISTDKLIPQSGTALQIGESGDTISLGSGATASGFGGGKLLQCVQTVLVTQPTTTSTTYADVSGFTVTTGTLASTSSKILLIVHAHVGTNTTNSALMQFMRDSTVIYLGTGGTGVGGRINASLFGSWNSAGSNGIASDTGVFLDDGGGGFSDTTPKVYKVQWRSGNSNTVVLNKDYSDSYGKVASSITAIEIGA